MPKYLCYQGDMVAADKPLLFADNRAFCYGDGFFETIRCANSEPLFFYRHYERILRTLALLNMQISPDFTAEYFRFQIHRLLQKNRIYKAARIRLVFFRVPGGGYAPALKGALYLITCEPLSQEKFQLPEKGLKVEVYEEIKKPINKLSALKQSSAMFYVMAGIWKNENALDDCLVMNQEDKLIEGLSSNLFMVKNQILYATTAECGCVAGTMRETILELAQNQKLPVKEVEGFGINHILEADELWLTNAIQGIRHVGAFRNRRYFHRMAEMLTHQLNKLAGL